MEEVWIKVEVGGGVGVRVEEGGDWVFTKKVYSECARWRLFFFFKNDNML